MGRLGRSPSIFLPPEPVTSGRAAEEGEDEEKKEEEGGRTQVQQSSYSFYPLPDSVIASVDLKRGR
jgi:hypothetical protein